MKKIFLPLCLCAALQITAQPSLEKLWETDSVIAVPESVLADPAKGILYVSLIDGPSWTADGKGGIAKLKFDGNIIDTAWITGLDAPKGMGKYGNRLYVADMTNVIVINIKKGEIEKRIAVDSAVRLNDITIDEQGTVYVSDSKTGVIYRVQNDVAVRYLDNLEGLNGIRAIKNDLYILSGKTFLKANKQKKLTNIAELTEGGDGLEPLGNGDFIATSWSGYIYYIYSSGKVLTLLDTHLQKKSTADIGYDPATHILYVPTFFTKTVMAYKVKW